MRHVIKLEKFSVLRVLLQNIFRRDQPRHISHDVRNIKRPADRHSLIALLDIEPVQILVHLDRIAESFSDLCSVQIDPFEGKF